MTHYISLTPDKILNSLMYRTLFYVNIYGSYKLSKNSPFFWPTLYIKPVLAPQMGQGIMLNTVRESQEFNF